MMIEELLAGIPLFAGLPKSELNHLANTLRLCNLPARTIILEEGGSADYFYFLIEGQVEIIKASGTSDERQLSIRGPGEFLGEMSFFNKEGTHTARVQAIQPVTLLELSRSEFDALLHRRPMLAYEMVRVVSGRLSESENTTIRDLREKNKQLSEAYQALQNAQAQLIEKEKMERELEVARHIQSSLLPRKLPRLPGFVFDVVMTPMRAVGGDLYDFISLGKGKLGIAIGDVSDHGVPAALFMALTTTLLRAEARRARSPLDALYRVNQQLLEINDTGMFVTLLYGILDIASQEFHYCRAGHELPVLSIMGSRFATVPMQQGMPLGIVDKPMLDEQTIQLESNSSLFVYTDGVTDALNPQKISFGKDHLLLTLEEYQTPSKTGLCHHVQQVIQTYCAGADQFDDIAMLSIQTA